MMKPLGCKASVATAKSAPTRPITRQSRCWMVNQDDDRSEAATRMVMERTFIGFEITFIESDSTFGPSERF
jgi:hypothetical protein